MCVCVWYVNTCIIYIYISADPGLRQGRGGAWDHRRCGTCPVGPPSKTLQTLQNPPNPPNTLQNRPNPPNTFPSRHPRAKATSPTGTPGPRPQQWLSMGFQSCRLPACKRSKPSKTFQTLQTLQNLPNPPNTVPSRHPRAKATAMAFYWLSKLPFASPQTLQTLQNPPNPPKPSKPSKHPPKPSKPSKTLQTLQTPSPTGTPGPRPLLKQAPQGQGHSNGFLLAFKAAVCQPANTRNAPKPSKPSKTLQTLQTPSKPSKPSKTFQTLQTPSKTLQTLQTPSPAGTPGPRPLPQQAPQGQGHFSNRHPRAKATAMAFYGLSKLPFARPQTLQTFQNRPNPPNTLQNPPNPPKPSKHLPQQAPQGQGHFSNKHPRAKATAMAFYWLSKLPFASPQTLQTLQNPPNPPKPSKPSKTLQTLQTPSKTLQTLQTLQDLPNPPNTLQNSQTLQNPPNPPNTLPSRHPRAKATSPTGTPGPRPQHSFLWAFKGTVCQPPNTPNAPKPSKPSKTLQTLQTPSKPSKHLPQQAPQGQGHFSNKHPRAKATAMAFYWLSKLPFASPQTLQTLQNPPNPPKPSKPSKHPPKPSKPSKPSKTFQTLQTPSKTLQTLQNLPNPPNTFPSRHPRAKATSPTGTPGPRPLLKQAPQGQGHSNDFLWAFKSCRLPRPKTLQTFQNLPNPPNPPKPSKPSKHLPQQAPQGQGHFPNRHPRAKAAAMAFYGLSKLPFARLQTLQTFQNLPNPPNPPKPSKPSKHLPQQAPQGQGHFSNKHPRAKATAMAFYWLSKLPFASPQTLQTLQNPPNPPKPSKPSKHPPKPSKHPPKPSKPSKPS